MVTQLPVVPGSSGHRHKASGLGRLPLGVAVILAIDPGPVMSGVLKVKDGWIGGEDLPNALVALEIWHTGYRVLIEGMSFQGKMAGQEVIDTAFWFGRFFECASRSFDNRYEGSGKPTIIKRREVLRLLKCENDAQVRACMIDVYGPPNVKEVVVPTGKRGQPLKAKTVVRQGPTHGVTGHAWQALGLYHAWRLQNDGKTT